MRHLTFWLILLVIIAGLLRLPFLNGSFWLDEAAQALESARPLAQQLDIVHDFQPPLLHLMIHFALEVSSSEQWLRLIGALLPGLGTIVFTVLIARQLNSPVAGLVAGGLLATSSFHIFYSQELRPYSLPALWAAVSWWLLLGATKPFHAPKSKAPKYPVRPWLSWVGITVLGLYSSYLYPFLVVGQVLLVIWKRTSLKPLVISLAMVGFCFLPWLPMFQQQLRAGTELRASLPGWSEVVSTPQLKALPLVAVKFVFGVLNVEVNPWYVLPIVALLVVGGGVTWNLITSYTRFTPATKKLFNQQLTLIVCWLLVPILVSWLVSFFVPVLQPKRVLFSLPAFYLAVAWLTAWVATQTKQRWVWVLPTLLLVINLISTWSYYTQPLLQRENWQAVHSKIVNRYSANNSIAVFIFSAPFAPWEWYDDGSYPTLSVEPLQLETDQALAEKLKTITEYEYVIVFDYLRDLTDPTHRVQKQVEALGYESVEVIDQPNIGFVRVYAQPHARLSDSH